MKNAPSWGRLTYNEVRAEGI